ncbi:hypothetical protein Barb4_01263 [Bacteroidales bacterium Barb4]|nr:hypothetical protein Barb4_01263 [Bacteroidales bacterium Barb4]
MLKAILDIVIGFFKDIFSCAMIVLVAAIPILYNQYIKPYIDDHKAMNAQREQERINAERKAEYAEFERVKNFTAEQFIADGYRLSPDGRNWIKD